jgi:hypothetical protein
MVHEGKESYVIVYIGVASDQNRIPEVMFLFSWLVPDCRLFLSLRFPSLYSKSVWSMSCSIRTSNAAEWCGVLEVIPNFSSEFGAESAACYWSADHLF